MNYRQEKINDSAGETCLFSLSPRFSHVLIDSGRRCIARFTYLNDSSLALDIAWGWLIIHPLPVLFCVMTLLRKCKVLQLCAVVTPRPCFHFSCSWDVNKRGQLPLFGSTRKSLLVKQTWKYWNFQWCITCNCVSVFFNVCMFSSRGALGW